MLTSMVTSFTRKLDTLCNSGCALNGNEGTESLPFPYKITKSLPSVNSYLQWFQSMTLYTDGHPCH